MGQLNGSSIAQPIDRRPIIAVIGASTVTALTRDIAQQVGRALAEAGWHLLCGGGGGVMEAACEGFVGVAPTARGLAIGILPGDDRRSANPFVEVPIVTAMGFARNAIIAQTADALVAVGGCSGTLSEIAFAWQANRPLVALANSAGWAEKLAGQSIDDRRSDVIFPARDAEQAVGHIRAKLAEQ